MTNPHLCGNPSLNGRTTKGSQAVIVRVTSSQLPFRGNLIDASPRTYGKEVMKEQGELQEGCRDIYRKNKILVTG